MGSPLVLENETEKKKKALIVVDMQNDFCGGGAQEVSGAEDAMSAINALPDDDYEAIVFTMDWHPANHCSFGENDEAWPVHCVANTEGAELHPDLSPHSGIEARMCFYKGADPDVEEYSALDPTTTPNALTEFLGELGVKVLDVVGVATNYCVKETAEDAITEGYDANVLLWCCVAAADGDVKFAIKGMLEWGVRCWTNPGEEVKKED
jgi:nicotinamidase/pyrazinamidase